MLAKQEKPRPRGRPKNERRPPGENPPKSVVAALKASEEYAEWFRELVEHCRKVTGWGYLDGSNVLERGPIAVAKEVGFRDPPKR
jgi:hypothetical protein